MSSLHQGVLRAVRLLPDVVKIGVEPETALPSEQGEEQILNSGKSPEPAESKEEPNKPDAAHPSVPLASEQRAAAEPLKELQSLIASLEVQLNEAKAKEQSAAGKISALEAEVAAAKNDSAQKEREFAASVGAAREQARAEGKQAGQAEGLQKGYDEGLGRAKAEVENQYREKFSALVTALEGVSAKLEERFAELLSLNQPRMLRLWQDMLKKMLSHEMTITPDGIFDVLSDVLSRLSDKNHVLIYVSPDDLALLEDKLESEFGDILRGVKHLELKPDAHVDKGSCLVETNLGVYDARWRTQFEQIDSVFESLFQKLGKPPKAKEPRVSARKKQEAQEETKALEKNEKAEAVEAAESVKKPKKAAKTVKTVKAVKTQKEKEKAPEEE